MTEYEKMQLKALLNLRNKLSLMLENVDGEIDSLMRYLQKSTSKQSGDKACAKLLNTKQMM